MMKYNYMKLFSVGILAAVFSLFMVPTQAQTTLDVEGVGNFHLYPTQYGDMLGMTDTLTGELGFVINSQGGLGTACDAIAQDLTDKIAVILYDHGNGCDADTKVSNAIDAGAKAVILVQVLDMNATPYPIPFQDVNNISDIPVFVAMSDEVGAALGDIAGATGNVSIYYSYDTSVEVIWSEDFSDGFDGPNGEWTSVSATAVDTTVWTYAPDAQTHGYFSSFLIDSPTKNNGAAVMDNGWYLSKGGTVEPPFNSSTGYGDTGGQLISPIIDLSNSGPVTVRWYEFGFGLNDFADSFVGFYYSLDGGTTWSARVNLTTKNDWREVYANPEIQRVFVADAAGAAEFRFKIEFRSDLFGMVVDDVQLVKPADTDLAITGAPFYTPKNYAQPTYSIDFDTFYFTASVENKGAQAQENVTLRAEILDAEGNVLHTVEGIGDTIIPPMGTVDLSISETYVPSDLEAGTYSVRYTVIPEEADEFPENNTGGQYTFKVTDNLFAMSETSVNSWYVGTGNSTKAIGNIYSIPAQVTEYYKIGDVQVAYRFSNDSVDVSDKTVTVLITAIADTVLADYSNLTIDATQDPFNQESFIQVAYQDVSLEGSAEGQLVTADGNEFLDAISLDPLDQVSLENGTRYIVWHIIQDSTIAIGLNSDNPIDRTFAPIIYDAAEASYYGGFTSSTQGIVQMHVQLASTVDKTPLPEEALTVYPNPVVGSILNANLKFKEATDATITIADMSGMVQSINVYENVLEQTITSDVSNLPAGAYLIRLSTQKGTRTVKFIKQ